MKAAENIGERLKRFNYAVDWKESKKLILDILGLSTIDYGDISDDYAELLEQQ